MNSQKAALGRFFVLLLLVFLHHVSCGNYRYHR